MSVPRLLRTTTFRVALLYLCLFLGSVGVVLGVVYRSTAGFVERELNDAIAEDVGALRDRFERYGLSGLVDEVRHRSADPHTNSFYLVATPAGVLLAGNLSGWPSATPDDQGWLHFKVSETGGPAGNPATAQAVVFALPGNLRLLVGRDMTELDLVAKQIIGSLGWIAAVVAALGVSGGVLLSRSVLTRIEGINRTTRRIMDGDLSERVARSCNGDEIDRLAGNLNAMLDRIEALMAGMRQVTENIAHDLRTPLSRLRSRIELVLLHPEEDAEAYRAALQDALVEADRLLATFKALLSIAQVEAHAQRDDFRPVDLAAMAESAAELYEPLAEEKGLAFAVEIRARPSVAGNAQLLAQAVANLLDNAVKYTPEGGRVVLSVEAEGPEARVTIADSGPGIPADMREAVRQRFVRLDAARATPGNGLGLSLVEAVARLHRAQLRLEDNAPGLRASLVLPTGA
ncbi:HAMP domain-containing sensor histidine kinase [Azospirillum sp. TSO22-1]|uniref:sensor histidine kinase n=1 Tax=Azospirillum sp. TSO22-1 TaxID=716789 RepID=UPI001FFF5327|nr:HAMP domain-containing sensor histidine kinase [Azospirillum sp. TSO22-1]